MKKRSWVILLILLVVLLFFGFSGVFNSSVGKVVEGSLDFALNKDKPFSSTPSFCGDKICNSWETSVTCPVDCGVVQDKNNVTYNETNTTGEIEVNITETIRNETEEANFTYNETNITEEIDAPQGSLICTETDGGKNIFQAGSCIQSYYLDFKISEITVKDRCLGINSLEEVFCQKNSISKQIIDCERGCFNGACLKEDSAFVNGSLICSETDGGKDYSLRGIVTDGFGNRFEDFCSEENLLVEYSCGVEKSNLFSGVNKEYISCQEECTEGKCLGSDNWLIRFAERVFS